MRRQIGHHQGFTLIEIMVVITIIGIMTGLIAINVITIDPQKDLNREALRFKTLLEMAQEDALFSQQEIGVIVGEHGYQFARWGIQEPVTDDIAGTMTENEDTNDLSTSKETISSLTAVSASIDDLPMPSWSLIDGEHTFRSRELDEDYEILLEVDHEQIDLTGGMEAEKKRQEAKLASKILEDDEEELKPSIFILSSGEISPFTMEIFLADDSDIIVKISGNEAGKIWIGDEEDEEL
ncbi:type II secretion system protein GspH [Ketobacter sp. MCCC 1A13808]|uniref:prepilin-type N-terminal cleavage/methylation domain-containing protein n=1 Tax=Ketobacter sp. MCCC 1A13808 TaxID=2602738 RepID=UPI0012EBD2F1|nr:prepilin-type N-terminal cleavage/methylation domain-containing protein [Ketobacter sp. MCCC 1A13808]MVF10526.1 type II secretion system protein GspH [Ketobacter sp. MCCC 1A13808]